MHVQHLVIPDLDQTVVSPRDEVRLVTAAVIIDTVDPFLMTFQCKIRRRRPELPNLRVVTQNVIFITR